MPLIWRTTSFSCFILFQGDLERIWVSTVLHFLSHYKDVFGYKLASAKRNGNDKHDVLLDLCRNYTWRNGKREFWVSTVLGDLLDDGPGLLIGICERDGRNMTFCLTNSRNIPEIKYGWHFCGNLTEFATGFHISPSIMQYMDVCTDLFLSVMFYPYVKMCEKVGVLGNSNLTSLPSFRTRSKKYLWAVLSWILAYTCDLGYEKL